jgi:hypothetical protein
MKSAAGPFTEGSFGSSSLPPVLMPELTMELPYEPSHIWQYLTHQPAPVAPSVDFLKHTGNAAEVGMMAELGTKPSLGMEWSVVNTVFTKVAGTQ